MALSNPEPMEVEVLDSRVQAQAAPNHITFISDSDDNGYRAEPSTPDRETTCYIDILSDDVLLEIVLMLLHDDHKGHNTHRTIMAVSRKWRQLVTMNPLCWTHVYFGSDMYQTAMSSFLLSGPTQLVDVTMDFRIMKAKGITMEDTCAMIMEHHTQIRSLDVLDLPDWKHLARFLKTWKKTGITTPNLKAISVSSVSRNLDPEGIFPRVLPKQDNHWPGAAHVESLTLSFVNPFVFPTMVNLTFLEMSTAGPPFNILGRIFSASPLVETLVLHQYEADDFDNQDFSIHPILAPSLRHLGVGSDREIFIFDPLRDDFCRLSAPNLEGMDILHCCWCTRRFQNLGQYAKLRRLRVHNFNYNDLEFLASLPPTVTLEVVQMPQAPVYILLDILCLANLECIVLTFEDRTYGFKVRNNFQDIWDLVRATKEEARSPTIMDMPAGEEPPSDVLAILGNNFKVRTSSRREPWLLKQGNLHYELDRNSESFSSS